MALFLILIITSAVLAYFWIKNQFEYWKRKGVETLSAHPLKLVRELVFNENSFADRVLDQYKDFKSKNLRYGGIYFLFSPFYVPMDIDIVKSIMQVDFQHFVDRGMYVNEKSDPLSAHLFSLAGNRWKTLRAKLTPTFTSGKMKMMFETLVKCTNDLFKVMDQEVGKPSDIKDVLGRFSTDVIGSVAFGLDCNALENADCEFRKKGAAVFHRNFLENLKVLMIFAFPNLSKMMNIAMTRPDITKFFMGVVENTVDYREKNNVSRKDFLQLLIELKNRGKMIDDEKLEAEHLTDDENKMTIEVIAAQSFIFFEAGFETSSTTMSFCLYELAKNKDVQDKVRNHVKHVLEKHNGKLTYEAMIDMHYLEQAINETLRKYPPVPSLNRICTKDYTVPGTDLVIEKGTRVSIPVIGIHHDPEYYPDPEKFDPDRFSEENRDTRPVFTFLPFGEGPRICIGQRFGMMQTKVGLVALLLNYEFTVNGKTKEPLEFEPKSFLLTTKGDIWLDYKKICTPTHLLM